MNRDDGFKALAAVLAVLLALALGASAYLKTELWRCQEAKRSEQCLRPQECPKGWMLTFAAYNGVVIQCTLEEGYRRTRMTIDRSLPPTSDYVRVVDTRPSR